MAYIKHPKFVIENFEDFMHLDRGFLEAIRTTSYTFKDKFENSSIYLILYVDDMLPIGLNVGELAKIRR